LDIFLTVRAVVCTSPGGEIDVIAHNPSSPRSRQEFGESALPCLIDSDIYIFEKRTKLVIADPSEETKLTQAPVSNALKGKPVRPRTLSIIRQTAARLVAH
jgi:hypothetical protein